MKNRKQRNNWKTSICNRVVVLSFALFGFTLFAQEQEIKKPAYVIIVNNQIITKEQLITIGDQGLLKGMHKGVSEEKRDELAAIHGEQIGDREFVILIDVFTEKEKLQRAAAEAEITPKTKRLPKSREDGLKLNIDDVASDFKVQMINGEEITLSKQKGKVVFINYWATWCAPCLMEFAEFPEKILEPLEGEDFVFIAIAIGEDKEKVAKKMLQMKKYGVDFNVGFDLDSTIWDQYASGAIPKSFIIDKNGVIKYISIGNTEGNVDKLALEINKLLKE